jgi:glucose-1-phosphate thymidylyltransferase
MAAGIREILIICKLSDLDSFKRLLGDGKNIGVHFEYAVQKEPKGLADALLVGKKFIGDSKFALILGDNIFHGTGLGRKLSEYKTVSGARIFAYQVADAREYGVVEFDEKDIVISIEEKPKEPRSKFAVPGLYFYDNRAVAFAESLKPSARNEIEITDLNKCYLSIGELRVTVLPRGTAWLDTGSPELLHDASTYVRIIEERQGAKVACLEELAWRMGWINDFSLKSLSAMYGNTPYGRYLETLVLDTHI